MRRVALPSPAVPLGRYARAWLEGGDHLDGLAGRIVLTEHARATLAAVEQGHADLAVLYASDARLGRRLRVLAEIDPDAHPAIRYVAAATTRAAGCPETRRLLEAWGGPRTRSRLVEAGFALPLGGEGEASTTRAPRLIGRRARTAPGSDRS